MSRLKNRTSQFLIDVAVLMAAFLLAMLVRFDWNVPPVMFRKLLIVLPYVVLLQYAFLLSFGTTRFSWRFISLRDAVRILVAVACASGVLVSLRLLSPSLVEQFPVARYGIVPLGVLLGDFLLAFVGLAGVRAFRRWQQPARGHDRAPGPADWI